MSERVCWNCEFWRELIQEQPDETLRLGGCSAIEGDIVSVVGSHLKRFPLLTRARFGCLQFVKRCVERQEGK